MTPSWKRTSETYKCSQNPSSFFSAKHVSDYQVVINVEDLAATDPDDSLEHGAFMKQQRLDLIKFSLYHEESDVGEVTPNDDDCRYMSCTLMYKFAYPDKLNDWIKEQLAVGKYL